jgi:flagellar protein FlaJ
MSERPSLTIYVDAIALTLFERLGRSLAKVFELDKHIRSAGMYIHPVTYACRVLLYTLISSIASISTLILVITMTNQPLINKVVYIVSLALIPITVFSLGITYPSIATSLRKLFVESELPFLMVYLATMAKGGVSVDIAIARVSELRVFKYVRAEASRVVRQVRVFGDDPLTAIEKVAHEHPSSKFRDVMLGYVATLRAGGDVIHYLETRVREILSSRIAEVKAMVDRLAIYLELYIILGVIVSLTIFTFFAVSGAITVVGGSRLRGVSIDPTIPMIYNVVVLPTLGIVTLLIIHLSHPRTSLPHRMPYIMMLLTLPIAVLSSLATLVLTDSWHVVEGVLMPKDVKPVLISVTIGLVVLSLPPWITYSIERRGTKGLTRYLADFLRDLSEVRKSGLSPEKCFIVLSERSYGSLTVIVRKAASALAIGLSLDRALARSVSKVKDWFLAVIFRFLVDSVLVGGGSPEVIDALANFTQGLAESEEELRSRLRAYVLLPYFGACMMAASPVIIVWQLISSSPTPPKPEAVASLILTLSLGAMINSYMMGLIAGKVSSLTVAAGFKHAVIMTLITILTILTTLTILKIL